MKTTDYKRFKIAAQNRPVSKSHVQKLKQSILNYGYFNSKPITVTPDFVVSDGQHRLMACMELGIPVLYEVDNISANDSMVSLNSTSNVWRLNEYIHHYAERGINNYNELRNFIQENSSLTVSNCINIFTGSSHQYSKLIRKGLKLPENDKLKETLELVYFFKGKLSFWNTSYIVRGIINFVKNAETKHIERLKQNTFGIIQCATAEQYVTMFNKLAKKK